MKLSISAPLSEDQSLRAVQVHVPPLPPGPPDSYVPGEMGDVPTMLAGSGSNTLAQMASAFQSVRAPLRVAGVNGKPHYRHNPGALGGGKVMPPPALGSPPCSILDTLRGALAHVHELGDDSVTKDLHLVMSGAASRELPSACQEHQLEAALRALPSLPPNLHLTLWLVNPLEIWGESPLVATRDTLALQLRDEVRELYSWDATASSVPKKAKTYFGALGKLWQDRVAATTLHYESMVLQQWCDACHYPTGLLLLAKHLPANAIRIRCVSSLEHLGQQLLGVPRPAPAQQRTTDLWLVDATTSTRLVPTAAPAMAVIQGTATIETCSTQSSRMNGTRASWQDVDYRVTQQSNGTRHGADHGATILLVADLGDCDVADVRVQARCSDSGQLLTSAPPVPWEDEGAIPFDELQHATRGLPALLPALAILHDDDTVAATAATFDAVVPGLRALWESSSHDDGEAEHEHAGVLRQLVRRQRRELARLFQAAVVETPPQRDSSTSPAAESSVVPRPAMLRQVSSMYQPRGGQTSVGFQNML